jgi:hypothetical protein
LRERERDMLENTLRERERDMLENTLRERERDTVIQKGVCLKIH